MSLRLAIILTFLVIQVALPSNLAAYALPHSAPSTATERSFAKSFGESHVVVLTANESVRVGRSLLEPDETVYMPTLTQKKPHRMSRAKSSQQGTKSATQVDVPFDVKTGAFYGVRSLNGYSAERASVTVPCKAAAFNVGSDGHDLETGYVYIGGWGAGRGYDGTPVDAGLQLSSGQYVSPYGAYSIYWKWGSNKPITLRQRFKCGTQKVALELYPLTDHLLVFTARVQNGSQSEAYAIVQETLDTDGWVRSGGTSVDGMILKRMTSIAQPPAWRSASSSEEANTDDSRFGPILWATPLIGRVDDNGLPRYDLWTSADNYGAPQLNPSDRSKVNRIQDNEGERILIHLQPDGSP